MLITLESSEREGLRRAATLLAHHRAGLADTGSATTVAELDKAIEVMRRLIETGGADVTPEEKVSIERAEFVLEGLTIGLDNADFEHRAAVVRQDVSSLASLVARYNEAAMGSGDT